MQEIKILIADDHQLIIDSIKLMLSTESDMLCVGEASNGQQVLDLIDTTSPDIILMDIDMPVLNGLDTCKQLQKSHPEIKVLVLSMLKESSLIKMMLKYGARGFLLKNAGKDEVLEAIRSVFNGKSYYSTDVADIILNSLKSKTSNKTSSNPFPKLSRREKQVLQLIVDENTTTEIAEKLFISFGTVETHRRNMLIKLGARNTAGLVRTCMEFDLLSE